MQENISFSIPFIHAWEKFKTNALFLIGVQTILVLVSYIEGQLSDISEGAGSVEWNIIKVVFLALSTYVGMGFVRICLKCTDNEPLDFDDILSPLQLFIKYLFAELIYIFAVVAGLILFIIPGLFLAVRLMFFGYLVVDKELSATEAIKQSFEMTEGYFWPLLGFVFVVALINIAGILLFLVGLLITLPVTSVATAYLYRQLDSNIPGFEPDPDTPPSEV
jgi:uncharacterized membrane protein